MFHEAGSVMFLLLVIVEKKYPWTNIESLSFSHLFHCLLAILEKGKEKKWTHCLIVFITGRWSLYCTEGSSFSSIERVIIAFISDYRKRPRHSLEASPGYIYLINQFILSGLTLDCLCGQSWKLKRDEGIMAQHPPNFGLGLLGQISCLLVER